jgi:hypothetical protein
MEYTAQFRDATKAWGTPGFKDAIRCEIEQLGPAQLPLQEGLTSGSYADAQGLRAMILGLSDGPIDIEVRAGLFYFGIIAGCNCADDPTPVDRYSEYCEVQIFIDKATGQARIALLGDV